MSDQITELLVELKTVCQHYIQRRFVLLADSKRISRLVRDRSVLVFVHYQAVENAADSLTYSPSYSETLEEISTTLNDESSDFVALEDRLMAFMHTLHNNDNAEIFIGGLTSNPLNKRMIDALFLLKDKIRIARQRLNDAGEEYEQEAYIKSRNRCSFAQSVYVGLLNRDIVGCTNEEIAKLEQVLYPAIEQADGSNFVVSIENTASFLEERILAPLAAVSTH